MLMIAAAGQVIDYDLSLRSDMYVALMVREAYYRIRVGNVDVFGVVRG